MENQHQHISKYLNFLDIDGFGTGRIICKTKDGGYLIVGDTFELEPVEDGYVFTLKYSKISVTKINKDYHVQWKRIYGDYAFYKCEAAVECRDGGFLLTGWTNSKKGSFSIPKPDQNVEGKNVLDKNVYILKISEFGSVEWIKTEHGYTITSVIETSDDGFAISGKTYNVNDHLYLNRKQKNLLFLSKYDAEKNLVFKEYFDVGSTMLGSYKTFVIESDNGNYLLTGTIDVQSKNKENESRWTSNILILCLTNEGHVKWKKELGGEAQDFPEKMIRTKNNEIAIVGGTLSEESLVDGVESRGDKFFLLIDEDGKIKQYKTFNIYSGGASIQDLTESDRGDFILVGFFNVSVLRRAFIVKIDSGGELLKAVSFGEDMNIQLDSIIRIKDNGYLCTGGSDWQYKMGFNALEVAKLRKIFFLDFYFAEDQ